MELKSVFGGDFKAYGNIVEGYDFTHALSVLRGCSGLPEGVLYEPSCAELEALPVFGELAARFYGGMPIQAGYCNGNNKTLNCLEYHRDSELNIAADDVILLLGKQQDIVNGEYDTARVKAFLCPAGTAVELYATTLHYAPCGAGFRVIIVLPRGTNLEKPEIKAINSEDKLLFARNKWLLAHPASPEAASGAYIGLVGQNICVEDDSEAN